MISTLLILCIIFLAIFPSKLVTIFIIAGLINTFPFHLIIGLAIAVFIMQVMKMITKRFNPFK